MPEFTVHFARVYSFLARAYITKCKTGHTNIDFQFGNAYPCSKLVIGFLRTLLGNNSYASDHNFKKMELRKVPDRMIVTPQDLVNITGKNIRACQRILRKIRLAYNKSKNGMVSAKELCSFCSLDIDEVSKYLKF